MQTFQWPGQAVLSRASPVQPVDGTVPTREFDISDVYEDAYSRLGMEFREPYQIVDATRSLRLLMQEWMNRGINLWTIVHELVQLDTGDFILDTPPDTIDVTNVFVCMDPTTEEQMEYFVKRWSTDEYDKQPQKNLTERPLRYWMDRSARNPKIVLWPIADQPYWISYTRLRMVRSPAEGLTGDLDAPDRMLPALVAGLAYFLAMKNKEAMALLSGLKGEYDRQWQYSQQEDREKSDLMIVPMDAWPL